MNETKIVRGWVTGRVQGVGFRWHVRDHALLHGITGYALNLNDGRVEVVLQGPEDAVHAVQLAVERGPVRGRVDEVEWRTDDQIDRNSLLIPETISGGGYDSFTIG